MLSTPYASRSGRSEGRMGRVFRVALGSGEYLAQMGSSFQDDLPLRLGQVREDNAGVSKGSFAEGPAIVR